MKKDIEKLNKKIDCILEKMDTQDPNSTEYKDNMELVKELWKLKIEEDKLNLQKDEGQLSYELKVRDQELKNTELELKQSDNETRVKMDKKSTVKDYVRMGVDIASVTLPLVFYGIWMHEGFKFEETQTFTSTTFKNLFQKFKA